MFWDNLKQLVLCPFFVKIHNRTKKKKKWFFPYIQKCQLFEKNYIILRSLWKSRFLPIFSKISTFRVKLRYFDITLKFSFQFLPISPKISKFKEMVPFFRFHWKNRFLSICPKISTFREKLHYFEITLKKSFSAHIFENINNSREITEIYIYLRKYQHLKENYVVLR